MRSVPDRSRSHAHDLERIADLRARQHPRRPRAGDEARSPPVGRFVPAPAPRMPDADQAEALVPQARPRARPRRDRQGLGGVEGPVRRGRGRGARGARGARRLPLDRDLAVRLGRRGRSDLARSDVFPRARRDTRPATALPAAARGDARDGNGRARTVRAVGTRVVVPRAGTRRRAAARDALSRRGRVLGCGDRRGGRRARR